MNDDDDDIIVGDFTSLFKFRSSCGWIFFYFLLLHNKAEKKIFFRDDDPWHENKFPDFFS